ncbi:MAG TPA: hypothetical protein VKA01_01685 [Vicinamibacteria bacterium]|nr:hypothetical protein [Vicinamibacteria bacterium]
MTSDQDWQQWARIHKACWEVQPLVEQHEGRRAQVGFEFNVFAQFPPSATGPDERKQAFSEVRTKLEELAEVVFPADAAVARFEAEPVQAAVRLRPETEFAPELQLTVRVFHKADYFQKIAEGDRKRLQPLEDRLKALGLKSKAWGRVS